MPPTAAQRQYVRDDLQVSADALGDAAIDALYTRAEADYTDNTKAVEAQVRVLAIRQLLAGAARAVDYVQNESQERQSQMFGHLKQILTIYERQLVDAEDAVSVPVKWGGLRRKPTRWKEYPDDNDPIRHR